MDTEALPLAPKRLLETPGTARAPLVLDACYLVVDDHGAASRHAANRA